MKIEALVNILVNQGLIKQEDYDKEFDRLYKIKYSDKYCPKCHCIMENVLSADKLRMRLCCSGCGYLEC